MKLLRSLWRDKSGASALEFSILAPILFASFFAIIEMSYKSILQTELDSRVSLTATELSINVQDYDSGTEFMTEKFCPEIKTNFLKCSDVEIGVNVLTQPLHTYRNNDFIGTWNTGCAGDYLMIELQYPLSNIAHPIVIGDIIERGGSNYYRSRLVIRREPQLVGNSSC